MVLSIVVPVYNVEKYLKKCLDSLLNQSLTDIEIILVNDGSTDSSGKICDVYSEKDKRIKVIHKENGGLSDARNIGIKAAQGEYITFLDSDDWIRKDTYERLYSLAQEYNADIVYCDFIKVYNENNKEMVSQNFKISCYTGDEIISNFYDKNSGEKVIVWNKIYKRYLFNEIKFPKGKIHEDEFTTYKLYHLAKKVIYLNLALYYYRQREGSIMNSALNINRLDCLEALEQRMRYFKYYKLDKMVLKTTKYACDNAIGLYLMSLQVKTDKKIIYKIKDYMRRHYIKFMCNPYIKFKRKILVSLSLLGLDNIILLLIDKNFKN